MTGCVFKRRLPSGKISWGYIVDAGRDENGKRIFGLCEHDPEIPDLVMIGIDGPVLADWHRLFAEAWARSTGRRLTSETPAAAWGPAGRMRGRVTGANAEIKRSVVARARRARKRVWIATAYFVPSWKLLRHKPKFLLCAVLSPHPDRNHFIRVRQGSRYHHIAEVQVSALAGNLDYLIAGF